jgi:type I restriction enzyme M protein
VVKDAQKALDTKVAAKYAKLTEAEIKTLVVEDKWLAALARQRAKRTGSRQPGADRAHPATGRTLRHAAAPKLAEEVEALAARVDEHLKKMGFQP